MSGYKAVQIQGDVQVYLQGKLLLCDTPGKPFSSDYAFERGVLRVHSKLKEGDVLQVCCVQWWVVEIEETLEKAHPIIVFEWGGRVP